MSRRIWNGFSALMRGHSSQIERALCSRQTDCRSSWIEIPAVDVFHVEMPCYRGVRERPADVRV